MPIDLTTTATLVASIQPETQLLFLKVFVSIAGVACGILLAIVPAATWKG